MKPARFLPDPQYVVPQYLHDSVAKDNARVPGHDYITYAYCTTHQISELNAVISEFPDSDIGDIGVGVL